MTDLHRGLHDTLLTHALAARLERLDASLIATERPLRREEAGDRLALHLSHCLMRAIDGMPEKERVARGVELAQRIVDQIEQAMGIGGCAEDAPLDTGQVLHAIRRTLPNGELETIALPLTPLLDTTLLTNAPGEPRVGKEIGAEIDSADRIDIVMAFVRFSGIRPLLDGLRRLTASGRAVRLLTTVYTGSTEAAALNALVEAGAAVRVSYDTGRTRLHAKAWLFHRNSGFSTAYIGSSNLTQMAQVDGLEWNVRVSAARNPDVIGKVRAVFESYWQDDDFVDYDAAEFAARSRGERGGDGITLPPTELHALPFQSRLLEQIALARARGHHRNLLVAATGTGKTVMAALDYASQIADGRKPTLLFVAHRKELLSQALATFRHALRDPTFGELWVGGLEPTLFEHVFASIQTLRAQTLERLSPTRFQVVIVDEFHHAGADSWGRLLDHVAPVELLGLTATPERADGVSVLDRFDGRIAAELRLWDAIEQQRLVPFAYFGVADGTDLRQVPWRRGRGYDVDGLSKVLTADDAIARRVLDALRGHVADVRTVRALGFCVSVAHARFMARVFTESGLPATAVWSDTPSEERNAALRELAAGDIRVLFSVDLFNEGVDVPSVDTLLMLRPTQSGTLFLQQLGRGLRHHHGKRLCTVLDFVGQHRREFRFDHRFRALLGGTRREVQKQTEADFPFLPSGCHLSLDPVARDIVLRSFRNAVPASWPTRVADHPRWLGTAFKGCVHQPALAQAEPRAVREHLVSVSVRVAGVLHTLVLRIDHGTATTVAPPGDVGVHRDRVRLVERGRMLCAQVAAEPCHRLTQCSRQPGLEHAVHVDQESPAVHRTLVEFQRLPLEHESRKPDRRTVAPVEPGPRYLGHPTAGRPGGDAIELATQTGKRAGQRCVVDERLHPAQCRQQHPVLDDVPVVLVEPQLDRNGHAGTTCDLTVEQYASAQMPLGRLLGAVALQGRGRQRLLGVPDHHVRQRRARIVDARQACLQIAPGTVEPAVRGKVQQPADRHLRHDAQLELAVAQDAHAMRRLQAVASVPERRDRQVTAGVDRRGHLGGQLHGDRGVFGDADRRHDFRCGPDRRPALRSRSGPRSPRRRPNRSPRAARAARTVRSRRAGRETARPAAA